MALDLSKGAKVAWVNFKELLAMVKESSIALYGAVMTVFAGIFLVISVFSSYQLWVLMRDGSKKTEVADARHLRDMEDKMGWVDSAKVCQFKLNNCLEGKITAIIVHDTIYLTKKKP